MKSVAYYELQWERTRLDVGRRTEPKKLEIRGRELVDALGQLADETGDDRFSAALSALRESGRIDADGHWRRRAGLNPDSVRVSWGPDWVADEVDRLVNEHGASFTQSYARIAAEWGEPASSFQAAMKRVERLYRQGLREAAAKAGHRATIKCPTL